jgi:probable rRNA maturation factor
MSKRFTELLIHGILHLFGYDHERNRYQAKKMEKKAAELLKIVASGGFKDSRGPVAK